MLALLVDGQVAARREPGPTAPSPGHRAAFAAMEADPNQSLVCAVDADGDVVGTVQLTFLPGLARDGAWRMQIEAMRVRAEQRGGGIGQAMLAWALARARERGCGLVQLTSDVERIDAHRFYRRHGFAATHLGFKLRLDLP